MTKWGLVSASFAADAQATHPSQKYHAFVCALTDFCFS